MPLSMIRTGQPGVVKKIGGREDTRRFLENLGFVIGAIVTVVSDTGGNIIVNVKESRVALGKEMANKIFVGGGNI
ncbi:MAG: ferrous iron transport protein A [Eubacterium sp.]|nr:ferrous iron transport protein A [Eubacterium sp.]